METPVEERVTTAEVDEVDSSTSNAKGTTDKTEEGNNSDDINQSANDDIAPQSDEKEQNDPDSKADDANEFAGAEESDICPSGNPRSDTNHEKGYQSENESGTESDLSQDRLRKKDDTGYEEDNEEEDNEEAVDSEVESEGRHTDSEGYEEEDEEESSEHELESLGEEEEEEHVNRDDGKKKGDKSDEEGEEEEGRKKSPSFVPRRTAFWDHDDRFNDETVEESRGGPGKKLWDKTSDRWGHDMYKEEEQGPKESWELEESRRQQDYFENRRRNERGGRKFGDFMQRSQDGDTESPEANREDIGSYRGRDDPDRRGSGFRRGRGGRGGGRERREPREHEETERDDESRRYRARESRRDVDRRGSDGRRDDKERPRDRQQRRNDENTGTSKDYHDFGRKTLNERFASREKRRSPQRDKREEEEGDDRPRRTREHDRRLQREENGTGNRPRRAGRHDEREEKHYNRRSDNEEEEYGWGGGAEESEKRQPSKGGDDRKSRDRDDRPRQERRVRKDDEEGRREQRREGDQQSGRKQRRDMDNEDRNARYSPSPKHKGRGRGVMSESRTRGSKTAEDFRKERPVRRAEPNRQRDSDETDLREEDEDGDQFEDAGERSPTEASKPAIKPKRYSSQRQRAAGKEDGGEGGNEEQTPTDNVAAGLQFNPQLLSYIQHQLQQQQQQNSQEVVGGDGGIRGINPSTVHLLQQHILQMHQQVHQLQMQNVVLRRQQLEQEQHQQQHQHQQLFTAGIPQLGPLAQQNPNVHTNAFRAIPGMGTPAISTAGLTSPGILYGMMQQMPGIPRPQQHQPQQVPPEGALVYTGGNTQQQLMMNQQISAEQMYGPVQGGLFVPPPHMQQQQLPSQPAQPEENADVNQPRKPRSAAIPIKPPPEVAR